MSSPKLNDIESVIVHWSESRLINDELGCDDDCDIEKEVNPAELDKLIAKAAKEVKGGYDKTSLTVKLKNGKFWCTQSKCYLVKGKDSLEKLIADD